MIFFSPQPPIVLVEICVGEWTSIGQLLQMTFPDYESNAWLELTLT